MRSLFLIVLLGITAFCAFGFAASFEPIEQGQQLLWRVTYGIGGLGSMAWGAWALAKGRRNRRLQERDE